MKGRSELSSTSGRPIWLSFAQRSRSRWRPLQERPGFSLRGRSVGIGRVLSEQSTDNGGGSTKASADRRQRESVDRQGKGFFCELRLEQERGG